jgi:hypothetical protein
MIIWLKFDLAPLLRMRIDYRLLFDIATSAIVFMNVSVSLGQIGAIKEE